MIVEDSEIPLSKKIKKREHELEERIDTFYLDQTGVYIGANDIIEYYPDDQTQAVASTNPGLWQSDDPKIMTLEKYGEVMSEQKQYSNMVFYHEKDHSIIVISCLMNDVKIKFDGKTIDYYGKPENVFCIATVKHNRNNKTMEILSQNLIPIRIERPENYFGCKMISLANVRCNDDKVVVVFEEMKHSLFYFKLGDNGILEWYYKASVLNFPDKQTVQKYKRSARKPCLWSSENERAFYLFAKNQLVMYRLQI